MSLVITNNTCPPGSVCKLNDLSQYECLCPPGFSLYNNQICIDSKLLPPPNCVGTKCTQWYV